MIDIDHYIISKNLTRSFICRLCAPALQFNKNGRGHQAVTKECAPQWQLSFPKGKKGKHAVVNPHKTPITYGMLSTL